MHYVPVYRHTKLHGFNAYLLKIFRSHIGFDFGNKKYVTPKIKKLNHHYCKTNAILVICLKYKIYYLSLNYGDVY